MMIFIPATFQPSSIGVLSVSAPAGMVFLSVSTGIALHIRAYGARG